MIQFPQATRVHKSIPKKAFYSHLSLTKPVQNAFVTDIDRIYVEQSLTQKNLNLNTDSKTREILVMGITVKKENYDHRVLEAIARNNHHKLLFILDNEGLCQVALFEQKLYTTAWQDAGDIDIEIQGNSLDEIWENLVEEIALAEETPGKTDELSLNERLNRQEQLEKLDKEITKLKEVVWKERQPKRKFELHEKMQEYRKKREELIHG